jgi:iron(III) transport system permease protein
MRGRDLIIICWLIVVVAPLAGSIAELVRTPSGWNAWKEADRLYDLGINSAALVAGTLVLSVPLGVAAVIMLRRTNLPLRSWLERFVLLGLFVPLPLLASAWQAAIGRGGVIPAWFFDDGRMLSAAVPKKPWVSGLPIAILLHSLAAIPWVIAIAGWGLRVVSRDAEEDALASGGLRSAVFRVVIPQSAPAIGMAALWVAVMTLTEITITDMVRVRTIAEEVYVQQASPDPIRGEGDSNDGLARAMAIAMPVVIVLAGILLLAIRRWQRWLPAPESPSMASPLSLGRWRWPAFAVAVAATIVLAGIPAGSLVWRLGERAGEWNLGRAGGYLRRAWFEQRGLILDSLAASLVTGLGAALFATAVAWGIRQRRLAGAVVAWVAVTLCAMPGPILGLGMKEFINAIVAAEEFFGMNQGPSRRLLYDGPSPLPVIWIVTCRFMPVSLAMIWSSMRAVPTGLIDAARVDGAGWWSEIRVVVWPHLRGSFGRATLAVSALSLGELSAGKLVETPGSRMFAHELFMQMHYGMTNSLAAMCLLLLAAVSIPVVILDWLQRRWRD